MLGGSRLLDQTKILFMRSDPEPDDADWRVDAEDAMRGVNAGRPIAAYPLEMQRGMARIRLQQLVVGARDGLHFRWKVSETSPELV